MSNPQFGITLDSRPLAAGWRIGLSRTLHHLAEKIVPSPATPPTESLNMSVQDSTAERTRLNRRIHLITGTQAARNLARYRKKICKQSAVFNRDAEMVKIEFEGRRFIEPNDAVKLMHEFLDISGVDTLL